MFSYPSFREVCDSLGDKVLTGISKSAAGTAQDLRLYRRTFPTWVARGSERGLANWIHDRMWDHLTVQLDGIPNVNIHDHEPTREITVGWQHRLRVKRHSSSGVVRTYPTPTALEFMFQGQLALEGLEEIRLITGYMWDSDLRQVGVPVISLRDGRDKIIWLEELPPADESGDTGTLDLTPPPTDGPIAPVVDINRPSAKEAEPE
ncbi:hypothetical protein EDC02_7411 [Micromonospora sp. Llam0]|uniref:hypothetical protein n=1 Tax=Micromonospora sp. Llam0 TaxID=2485143 RepID=UPI000F4A9DAD|nr:hypothetical protein [Micromonospora sp. Llam0]ROO52483.1 hypothetical protein EDC02_7411 [Micromonospora sp. Llam0]